MALPMTIPLGEEVHLHIGDVGAAPEEVVPHQPVEVEGRGGTGVGLGAPYLGHRPEPGRHRFGRGVGGLEGRPFRKIQDHLELRLVVERQHLHLHCPDGDQRHRAEQEDADAGVETVPDRGAVHQCIHHAGIPPAEAALHSVPVPFGAAGLYVPGEELEGEPGRHHKGHRQRREHRRRGADRDRPHVGTHHPGNERHRQDRGDHGESGQDGRVADLVHTFDRRRLRRTSAQLEVTVDVLHHHDRVVHQDADREDQREEGDPVERVAQRVVREHRERERHRHRHQHHQCLAPAEEDPDEERDTESGEEEVEDQLARLLGSGLAVIPGDLEPHARREEPGPGVVHPREHRLGQGAGVGAGPLGDHQGDGVLGRLARGRVAYVVHRFGGTVDDGGHRAEIDRAALPRADHHRADIRRVAQLRSHRHQEALTTGGELAGREPAVGPLQCAHHLDRRDPRRREPGRIEDHPQLARAPADERRGGDVGDGTDLVGQVRRHLAQHLGAVAGAVERERQEGHVIDGVRPHQRRERPGRGLVRGRSELRVHRAHTPVLVLAHLEPHRDKGPPLPRGAVYVLDAGDLPHQFLDRPGQELLYFGGRGAREGAGHVDHRYRDLWLFLARGRHQRDPAHRE